ncbi:hypothetical protein [Noviherbaspirillum sp. ST9]|uniref:hypothetical protein n=1 Tax=Noviherbaspirillum sp. ST9 TaxID=3401606 RepID=UPI003B587D15
MILDVETLPGPHGDREPVAFLLGARRVVVVNILDRWLSADCSYFKVEADESSIFILRHFHATREWELTLYQAPTAHAGDRSRN